MADGSLVSTRAYVSAFNLRGAAQQKRVSALSGGERNRVHLAKQLRQRCNVLVLACGQLVLCSVL